MHLTQIMPIQNKQCHKAQAVECLKLLVLHKNWLFSIESQKSFTESTYYCQRGTPILYERQIISTL